VLPAGTPDGLWACWARGRSTHRQAPALRSPRVWGWSGPVVRRQRGARSRPGRHRPRCRFAALSGR